VPHEPKGEGSVRLPRLLFVLLLGVTLTLVCQGHLHEGHFTPAHLTFLGEPDDGQPLASSTEAEALEKYGQALLDIHGVDAPGTALELAEIATLGLVLFAGLANASRARHLPVRNIIPYNSLVACGPEPPPPRCRAILPLYLA